MNVGKGAGASAIFAESASALSPIINLIPHRCYQGHPDEYQRLFLIIDVILEQRAAKLMTIDFRDKLTALEARSQFGKSLGLDAGTLYCQKPGIVSFRLDGLEAVLARNGAEALTPGKNIVN